MPSFHSISFTGCIHTTVKLPLKYDLTFLFMSLSFSFAHSIYTAAFWLCIQRITLTSLRDSIILYLMLMLMLLLLLYALESVHFVMKQSVLVCKTG